MSHQSCLSLRREFAGIALIATLAFVPAVLAQTPQSPDSTVTPTVPDSTAIPPAPEVAAPPVANSPARVGMGSEVPASMLRGGPMGELLSVYPPRGLDEIQRQLDNSRSLQRSAESDIAGSRRLADAADGQVRIMTGELETTKTRLSVARKMKNDAERMSLAGDEKRQNAERKYLVRLRDAMRADAARLDSESDAASARVKALELEVEVARRHAQLASSAAPTASALADYRALLKRMLQAQENAAKRGKDAAEKRKQVAEGRLQQLEALTRLAR